MMITDSLLREAHVNHRHLGGGDGGEKWDLVVVSWVVPFLLLWMVKEDAFSKVFL